MPSLKEKSIKALFWDFTGRIGLQGVGFFVSIFLARILAPEDFGLLAIITVVINLASVFLDLGFSTALIQRREVQESHYAAVFYMNVAMGLVLAVIVFFSAPFIAIFYDNSHLVNLIRLMSISFMVNSFGNVPRAKLQREMNFKAISIANIFAAVVSAVVAIVMAWKGFGVWSLAIQSIANQLLANAFLFFTHRIKYSLCFSLRSFKELWGFSSRVFFSRLLDTLFINADSLAIGKVLNASTLGFYYRAKSLESFSHRYTTSTIASVLLPSLSTLQCEPTKLKQVVTKVFNLLSIISFFVCGLLLVTGREIIILLFSAKWEPSVILFQIIISGAFASQLFSVFYNTLLSTGHAQHYFTINVVSKALLFFNLIALSLWGLNLYLLFFTAIRITIFFMGMFYVTNVLALGGLLYRQTFKYLFIYCTSVVMTLFLKNEYVTANLGLSLLLTSFEFLGVFLLLAYLTKCEGLKLLGTELVAPLQNFMRRKCLI